MPKEGVSLIGHDDILRYEEILRVVNAAIDLGLVKVRVTGGEPLIRRGVLEFLRKLTAFSQIQEVTLTTNGILLEETAEELWNTGIKRLNVSLDSLDSDKYAQITGGGDSRKF
jgi:cyclic pyranopterin phosphate synthase